MPAGISRSRHLACTGKNKFFITLMDSTTAQSHSTLSYLKLFLALSRATHALLDIATPCLAALVWLNAFPPVHTVILGIGTALAGYLAVYALNDVVDYRLDKEKVRSCSRSDTIDDLDALYVRHPMAHGLLSMREGLAWTGVWALLALAGAYLLNPACVVIFLLSVIFEICYCLMLQVSHLRIIISGAVKTMGGVAAVLAVDPRPSGAFLLILFLWLFFWEIGGQNIPNDLTDVDEDAQLNARTVPVRFGPDGARKIILASLSAAVIMSVLLFGMRAVLNGAVSMIGALAIGSWFLLVPGFRLYTEKTRLEAARLFNRASYYPLALLCMVAMLMLWR
jgi:4-hydroxybenzoate polyprenyltransferase